MMPSEHRMRCWSPRMTQLMRPVVAQYYVRRRRASSLSSSPLSVQFVQCASSKRRTLATCGRIRDHRMFVTQWHKHSHVSLVLSFFFYYNKVEVLARAPHSESNMRRMAYGLFPLRRLGADFGGAVFVVPVCHVCQLHCECRGRRRRWWLNGDDGVGDGNDGHDGAISIVKYAHVTLPSSPSLLF